MPESDTPLKILSSRVLRFLRVNHVNHQKRTPYIILRLDFLEFSESTKSDARKQHPFENFELSISASPAIPASQPCQPPKAHTLYHSKTGFSLIQRVNQKRCPKGNFVQSKGNRLDFEIVTIVI